MAFSRATDFMEATVSPIEKWRNHIYDMGDGFSEFQDFYRALITDNLDVFNIKIPPKYVKYRDEKVTAFGNVLSEFANRLQPGQRTSFAKIVARTSKAGAPRRNRTGTPEGTGF